MYTVQTTGKVSITGVGARAFWRTSSGVTGISLFRECIYLLFILMGSWGGVSELFIINRKVPIFYE